ncbi:MAG TPA: hypothetical protein VF298_08320, partial [Bacteroidales bacterium]
IKLEMSRTKARVHDQLNEVADEISSTPAIPNEPPIIAPTETPTVTPTETPTITPAETPTITPAVTPIPEIQKSPEGESGK